MSRLYRVEYKRESDEVWTALRDAGDEPCVRSSAAEALAWAERQRELDSFDGISSEYRVVEVGDGENVNA